MPLPAALAARLAKRGLISKRNERKPEEVDEVFAWDYDEAHPAATPVSQQVITEEHPDIADDTDAELIHEELACPNKTNTYHECSHYCTKRWGYIKWTPDETMTTRREKLLKKHPLPDTWSEVGDPKTGRYYYWNMETDNVSWLPPSHPKSRISLPADKLKDIIQGAETVQLTAVDEKHEREKKRQKEEEKMEEDVPDLSSHDDDLDADEHEDFEKLEEEIMKERQKKSKKERRGRRGAGGGAGGDDVLDPMDPASYSDIPRGNWTSGLDLPGSAKTGVDATASGPLFQQRPYPSPGAVLKMNRQNTTN